MSWKIALDTIDARLRLCSDAENGSLRHWKTIIEKAYADFQENFPGFEPNSFASLVAEEDGRAEERENYGI